MDFDLTDEQTAVTELAARLLGDLSTPDALRAIERSEPDRFDRPLWAAMADAGILGLFAPEEIGGAGLIDRHRVALEERGWPDLF